MTIIATFSEPQQRAGATVSTVTLHTARSGRACGEFLLIRHHDGCVEYRSVDDVLIAPDEGFGEVAATVRRQHFQRAYATLRDQFHGKAVA